MAWQVGAVLDQSDFMGFNIIDATTQRPIVSFSYSSRDDATNAHGLVAKALEHAKHVGVVPPPAAPLP
jgi:hypothetical protein